MEFGVNLRDVIEHTLNGNVGEHYCFICLSLLNDLKENMFTKICKEDFEFSVGDVLNEVCNIQVEESDHLSVCHSCFREAAIAYKFYLKSKRTNEILHHHVDKLNEHMFSIDPENLNMDQIICISLDTYEPVTKEFSYNIHNINQYNQHFDNHEFIKQELDVNTDNIKEEKPELENNVIIVTGECGELEFYKIADDGSLIFLDVQELDKRQRVFKDSMKQKKKISKNNDYDYIPKKNNVKEKGKRKRGPMSFRKCSKCPVKYRYTAKLKEHMKVEHNIDLYICKVCRAVFEDESDFCVHLRMHTNIYTCDLCNTIFKKRNTIISHLQTHNEISNMGLMNGSHVCELCGHILRDADSLEEHYDKKHDKKYMCFYCGKSYKVLLSFEAHIKKHEAFMANGCDRNNYGQPDRSRVSILNHDSISSSCDKPSHNQGVEKKGKEKNFHCEMCGRRFIDARALMWHQRIHNNEKPYNCEECGRAFISLNRRNQHMLCSHTAPKRRCPLCPALFHLRSMINTHISKVHLNTHKRRNRVSKHQNVHWKTETVQIQDLSIPIQNQLLEMRTKNIAIL